MTQVSRETIEKAVQAHTMARNGQDENRRDAWSAMEAALEAVGYFDMRAKLDALVTQDDVERAVDVFETEVRKEQHYDPLNAGVTNLAIFRKVLAAALPHAVTQDQFLEKLAVEADREAGAAEPHGSRPDFDRWKRAASASLWLRARKGGA